MVLIEFCDSLWCFFIEVKFMDLLKYCSLCYKMMSYEMYIKEIVCI